MFATVLLSVELPSHLFKDYRRGVLAFCLAITLAMLRWIKQLLPMIKAILVVPFVVLFSGISSIFAKGELGDGGTHDDGGADDSGGADDGGDDA
jgi:hypothetical protein